MAKISVLDFENKPHQIELDLSTLGPAEAAGAPHVLRYLDGQVSTGDNPSVSKQVYAAMGIGREGVRVKDVQEAKAVDQGRFQAASTNDGSVTGRLVMSAYLMDSIENKLRSSDSGLNAIFNAKAAVTDSIPDSRFERPIINYSGPEGKRSKPVAQLSEPESNVLLTASDRAFKIATNSIGIEYSDQVSQNLSIPIVALSMQRQAEVEYTARVYDQLKSLLNGDTDLDMAALTGVQANTLDSTITTAGTLTQKAWMKFLYSNSDRRKIDTVVCDLDTAIALEGRTGRPTVSGDNPTSARIDTLQSVMNPTWASTVDVIVVKGFPANTIMGFDSRYGYHLVTSTSLAYNAVESYAIRRSTKLRVDYGNIAYRLFDDAFSVLTLTV